MERGGEGRSREQGAKGASAWDVVEQVRRGEGKGQSQEGNGEGREGEEGAEGRVAMSAKDKVKRGLRHPLQLLERVP